MALERNGPRFHIDDQVHLAIHGLAASNHHPTERFVIVSVMPRDRAGNHQYRVRPVGTGPHRVATELELRR